MLLILLSAPLGQAVFFETATLSGSEFRPRNTQIIILHCLQSVHSAFLCKNGGTMLERRLSLGKQQNHLSTPLK